MRKFNVGDEVVCVNPSFTGLCKDKKYIVKSVWQGEWEFGSYLVEVDDVKGGPFYSSRFKLVEDVPKEEEKHDDVHVLTISYNGLTVRFDPSKPKSRKLVDVILDVIYKEVKNEDI